MHPSSKLVKIRRHLHIRVILNGTGSGDREILRGYLASLFTSEKALRGDCGVPALEVP
jgi:hypothetical protein